MNATVYQTCADELRTAAFDIAAAKRPAYTEASADVLHNFKDVARRAGIDPKQAWLIYFLKHVSAIAAAAKSPDIPQAEPLIGRFADAINYLELGWALFNDDER